MQGVVFSPSVVGSQQELSTLGWVHSAVGIRLPLLGRGQHKDLARRCPEQDLPIIEDIQRLRDQTRGNEAPFRNRKVFQIQRAHGLGVQVLAVAPPDLETTVDSAAQELVRGPENLSDSALVRSFHLGNNMPVRPSADAAILV
eukprot:2499918-Rhodomonas_salina.2